MAVLLAAFICGPTCLCFAPAQPPPQEETSVESCCQAQHDHELPEKTPAPCECNKCLVKRTLSDAPVHPPAAAWTSWAPAYFDAAQLFHAFPVLTLSRHIVTDTGPPHVPRADLVRHRALLL